MPTRLPHQLLTIAVFASICLVPLQSAIAQTLGTSSVKSPLSLSQVVSKLVEKNAARAQALQSYQSRRTYTLVYKGFPPGLSAQMVADLTYQAPDTKKFTIVSTHGPKLLVDQVLRRLLKEEASAQQKANRKRISLDPENYRFSNLEYRPAADGCSYVLSVEPIVPSKYLYSGQIWVHDQDFAVCRIEAEPAKNPSFWIKSTKISELYSRYGEFWLPKKNTSVSYMRIGGHAILTIDYGDYTIPDPAADKKSSRP